MTSISQAAVAASVLVGLVSIPAVSKTAPPANSVSTQIPNVSTDSAGREVVKSVSPSGFHATISTAYEEFTANANPDEANASLETPTADLQMEKTADGAKWVLSTARGQLTIQRTHDSVTEITETPEGTLQTVRKDGGTRTVFQGSDREQVEEARDRLHALLQEKKRQLDDRRTELRPDRDLMIKMNSSLAEGYGNNSEQHALVINDDDREIDLDGWTVSDGDEEHPVTDVSLSPGETLRIYSSSSDDIDYDGKAVYDAMAWTNSGDTAILIDSEGEEVARSSF